MTSFISFGRNLLIFPSLLLCPVPLGRIFLYCSPWLSLTWTWEKVLLRCCKFWNHLYNWEVMLEVWGISDNSPKKVGEGQERLKLSICFNLPSVEEYNQTVTKGSIWGPEKSQAKRLLATIVIVGSSIKDSIERVNHLMCKLEIKFVLDMEALRHSRQGLFLREIVSTEMNQCWSGVTQGYSHDLKVDT